MPHPSLDRTSLLKTPQSEDELARHYTFNESDLALIRRRRGDDNRLGFAVQLCLLRFPGRGLAAGGVVENALVEWISRQLKVDAVCWPGYFSRSATRREYLLELRSYLGLRPFGRQDYRQSRAFLISAALQTDKAVVLAARALEEWRGLKVILPPIEVVERLASEAITRANRQICTSLAEPLLEGQRAKLDGWLDLKPGTRITWLSPVKPIPGTCWSILNGSVLSWKLSGHKFWELSGHFSGRPPSLPHFRPSASSELGLPANRLKFRAAEWPNNSQRS